MTPDDVKSVLIMTLEAKLDLAEAKTILNTWTENDTEIYPPELTAIQERLDRINTKIDDISKLINKR